MHYTNNTFRLEIMSLLHGMLKLEQDVELEILLSWKVLRLKIMHVLSTQSLAGIPLLDNGAVLKDQKITILGLYSHVMFT